MLGKKSTKEKKRRHCHGETREVDRKRRSTESSIEDTKDEQEQPDERPEEASDTEEGGLDLNVPFKPISAYATDRQEMLEQCFRVLGENKLKKMLPDELKNCPFDEIKRLCWEQLEQLSQSNLLRILEGKDLTGSSDGEEDDNAKKDGTESQQDNNVDSTSSLKENVEVEDLKQGGGSGEESDVLSINADADDSDIEGHKDDKAAETPEEVAVAAAVPEEAAVPAATPAPPQAEAAKPAEPKVELQQDIDRSVSEILALAAPAEAEPERPALPRSHVDLETPATPQTHPVPAASAQPSLQQLELLELEMRARAIKALMKANEVKKQDSG